MKTFHLVVILERGNSRKHLFRDFRARSTKNARRRARKIILENARNFQTAGVPFLFVWPKGQRPINGDREMWRGKWALRKIRDLRETKDPESFWVCGYGPKAHDKVWAKAA